MDVIFVRSYAINRGTLDDLEDEGPIVLSFAFDAKKIQKDISDPEKGIHLSIQCASNRIPYSQLYISRFPSPFHDVLSSYTHRQGDNISTDPEEGLALASAWLANCEQKHVLCLPKASDEQKLPTRVIAVGSNLDCLPRICMTNGQHGRYLALSYCWGKRKSIVLTVATFQAYQVALPVSDLPLTLQHAIEVTRKLGFSYLWIDALCIIQDSDSDKTKEISSMADIYRNATLTIAAANGPDSSSGLFSARDPWYSRPCGVELKVTTHTEKIVAKNVHIFQQEHRGEEPATLDTRGWVLQEEILSTRILRFETGGINWYCTTSWACESDPVGKGSSLMPELDQFWNFRAWLHNEDFRPGRDLLAWEKGRKRSSGSASSQTSTKVHYGFDKPRSVRWDHWYAIVENYTKRSLTVSGDRLIAISGLATAMDRRHRQSRLGGLLVTRRGTYLAGLWKEDLKYGLHWYVSGSPGNGSAGPADLAPTWSWASVRCGSISFYPDMEELDMKMVPKIDILQVSRKSPSWFGDRITMTDGWIRVRAPFKLAVLRKTPLIKYDGSFFLEDGANLFNLYERGGSEPLGVCALDDPNDFTTDEMTILCLLTFFNNLPRKENEHTYVPRHLVPGKPFAPISDCIGMALAVSERGTGNHCRLGLVQTLVSFWYEDGPSQEDGRATLYKSSIPYGNVKIF